MKSAVLFFLALIWMGCSTTQEEPEYYVPKPNEFELKPGERETLDDDIAYLLRNNQRVEAMRKCNDVLFASKSEKDRESAQFWRAVILALEEIENGSLKKAVNALALDSAGVKSDSKLYVSELLKHVLAKLRDTNKQTSQSQTYSQKIESENQQLKSELTAATEKVKELEKLLQKLESVN